MLNANVLPPMKSTCEHSLVSPSLTRKKRHSPPVFFCMRSQERLGGGLAIFLPLVIPGPSCGECWAALLLRAIATVAKSLDRSWPAVILLVVFGKRDAVYFMVIFFLNGRQGRKKMKKIRVYTAAPWYVYMCWAPVTSGSPGNPTDEAQP